LKPDVETIAKTLDAVNQRFYETHHSAFNETRQFGWPGWRKIMEHVKTTPRSVLDIGCGNGRFARFLQNQNNPHEQPTDYLGLDRNAPLLEYAQVQSLNFRARWLPWSWTPDVKQLPPLNLSITPDLVVAFGVLHHIYGAGQREAFIAWCGQHVAHDGYLAISAWDFGRHERYLKKCQSDEAVYRETGIAPAHLDTHDYFLGFGKSTLPMRYCHWVDDVEADLIMAMMETSNLGFRLVLRYEHPDDLNRYWLWKRADGS
jgi:tRNA (uracil-5-)-methyltransferase TRM9